MTERPKIDKEEVLRRIGEGANYNAIATDIGCTRAYVSSVALAAGIRKRNRKAKEEGTNDISG